MVMELVEGENLRTRSRNARIPLPMLMDFAMQVLSALEYAHARGVVHRDIKPANIMVSPAGLVKVLDFGIAISQGSVELTKAGSLIGSPLHMSPEQIRGEKATQQSDIYSFGVTLYELIAGRPPLNGTTTYELMMAHLNLTPTPLAELRPDVPARSVGHHRQSAGEGTGKTLRYCRRVSRGASLSEYAGPCRDDNHPSGQLASLTTARLAASPLPDPLVLRSISWCATWHHSSAPFPRSS
jgi:serine/threonine protein kinase